MNILYLDPGYGTSGLTCVESYEYNPTSGVAFTGTNTEFTIPIDFYGKTTPALNSTDKFANMGFQFSVYCSDDTSSNTFSISTETFNGWTSDSNIKRLLIEFSQNATSLSTKTSTPTGKLPTLVITAPALSSGLHNIAINFCAQKSNSTSGLAYPVRKLWIDIDGNVTTPANVSNLSYYYFYYLKWVFPANENILYVSNIIAGFNVEDTGGTIPAAPLLSVGTQIVRLPTDTPVTDFQLSYGEYVGNTAGQTLLQTINAGEAVAKHGGSSKVLALASYGHPGYRVGSAITQAYGISKSGETVTQHGSTDLSAETDANAFVAWEPDENTTLADLDGLQVGWQI